MSTKQPNLYGLTLKQSLFVTEYLKDRNATQAAIRAGYSPKSADRVASRMLSYAKVKLAIDELAAAAQARSAITADRVLLELAKIAFADTTVAVWVEEGRVRIRDTKDLDSDTRKAISEISETVTAGGGGTLKVKFHDKLKALELLGRYFAMFKDKLDVDAGETIVGILEELRKRREAATGGGQGGPGR